MPSHRNSVRMDFIYNSFADVFDEKTVIMTWDTLHLNLTLSIYVTLVIFIWITRLDPCQKNSWFDKYYESEDLNTDKEILSCLAANKAMYA